ncbi:MAG: Gfo/Idh/MocA family oxidoreductase, partial [Armatimonadetes bacterium]|nr:Gfo/Idh/MocA family oxidoreductase [Armatimonadota bacterium]
MRGAGGTDMMPVAVLGCGNVGSRHLQGLLKLDLPMEIHVYDPSPASLARAEARASDVPYTRKEIRWYSRADSLARRFHAAIIASISAGRVPLVELAARSGCRYLLMEKLVCQSMGEYREIERLCDEAGITAWVNFNCRYFRGYERVTGELPAAGTICRLAAFGGNHGLAC